jgi:hypothetical protein
MHGHPEDEDRSGQGQQQQERGLEQPGHQGLPQAAEQQRAADDSQLKPPETPFPPDDTGATTQDNRHADPRTAMSGEAPGG